MAIDASFVEQLLHEDESTSLDFKRDQYRFQGVDADTKSELLKDILAFLNSWRRSPAYILVGVDEVRGGRSQVVGVTEHLDDAQLQQFVNSKTQRPVTFFYRQVSIDGKDIGLIEIPIQQRPVYLRRDFGRLSKERVYIRRGSSTAEANPDEIARMGAALVAESTPTLELVWADADQRRNPSHTCTIRSVHLDPRLSASTVGRHLPYDFHHSPVRNKSYADELIHYVYMKSLLVPIGFCLKNLGETVGNRIRFVGSLQNANGAAMLGWGDLPEEPSADVLSRSVPNVGHRHDISPDVRVLEDQSELTIDFGDVRPGDEVWTDYPVLVGARADGTSSLEGELRGDNIPKPLSCELKIAHSVERRPMRSEDVLSLIRRQF
ncbi:MAG: ATP-binding protein [Acidobacteria bacterium]|nr:ATP-binding protein [Acidobacteriota bacterium]